MRFVFLIAAIVLTAGVQALWLTGSGFAMLFPTALWTFVGIDWCSRHIRNRKQDRRMGRGFWTAPLCFAAVVVCGITHLPLRVRFWTQKAKLQALEKSPSKSGDAQLLQVAKSGKNTRILLYENLGFSDKTAFGFAHCPNDAGCEGTSFKSYWDHSGDNPEFISHRPIEYYWDYANGKPTYVSVGDGWYAVRVTVLSNS